MDTISGKIKKLPEVDLPAGLHEKIMLRVRFHRARLILFSAASLIFLNGALTLWHTLVRLVESDAISFIKITWGELDFSGPIMVDLRDLLELLPVTPIIMSLLNITIFIFIINLAVKFKGRNHLIIN